MAPPQIIEQHSPLGIASFTFADLFDPQALQRLDALFCNNLKEKDAPIYDAFMAYRQKQPCSLLEESELLIAVAKNLEDFLAKLWGIEAEVGAIRKKTLDEQLLGTFRKEFLQKRCKQKENSKEPTAADWLLFKQLHQHFATKELKEENNSNDELRAAQTAYTLHKLQQELLADVNAQRFDLQCYPPQQGSNLAFQSEISLSKAAQAFQPWYDQRLDQHLLDTAKRLLELLQRCHAHHPRYQAENARPWFSDFQPKSVDSSRQHLLNLQEEKLLSHPQAEPNTTPVRLVSEKKQARQGFQQSDRGIASQATAIQTDYCLICHPRHKDSCRHGLRQKDGSVKSCALGVPLTGCPLEERISEAHALYRQGYVVAALAIICIDNPMCPGTGHRICNDCMKSCIFQKQEAVQIPAIESSILEQVLNLPYGFEIYSLLLRFHPLIVEVPSQKPYHGHKVLIAGLGPAGYTLAHYLLRQGFGVVAIDGLKLQPLTDTLTGKNGVAFQAIHDVRTLYEDLDERLPLGFGGVAEYGITVRWNKNNLKLIYLHLCRQKTFMALGGMRLGSNLNLEDAFQEGFDHVALAFGAGSPNLVTMGNNFPKGMRTASDFLMTLQSAAAFHKESLSNLLIELPAVVIGGGLTAIDSATELLAYYPRQLQKIAQQVADVGEQKVRQHLNPKQQPLLQRFLEHAKLLEKIPPQEAQQRLRLLQSFGGVNILYRKRLQQSPAYKLNHEEVEKAFEEGIGFVENITPLEAICGDDGNITGLRCRQEDGSIVLVPCRTAIIAAGTKPNTIYDKEYPQQLKKNSATGYFKAFKCQLVAGKKTLLPSDPQTVEDSLLGFFTSFEDENGHLVSFFGDNHPHYAGSVVKAMASAQKGHKQIVSLFENSMEQSKPVEDFSHFSQHFQQQHQAVVEKLVRHGPHILEIIVKAPKQVEHFKPGQFFKLQNFLTPTAQTQGLQNLPPATRLMESLALTGAYVEPSNDLLSMVVLEMGSSSELCRFLQKGDVLSLMGPTGSPTQIVANQTVLLCGGGLGNAVLLSIGQALLAKGNRVLYAAGYRCATDVFLKDKLEQSCQQLIWSSNEGPLITASRAQDRSFNGNIIESLLAYAKETLANNHAQKDTILLSQVDRIISIGSDGMMAALQDARHHVLKPYLKADHLAIASINSPMQCMMKEICGQCLQRRSDPLTKQERYVFSCFEQDQPQDEVDFKHLKQRLQQNHLAESVSYLWLQQQLGELQHARS